MSYITSIRNNRMDALGAAIAGGKILICKGAKALALPASVDILSEHQLPATIPAAANGTLSVTSGIGIDTSANNTGAPTWVAFVGSDGTIKAAKNTTELSLSITYPTGDTQIVATREVRVSSLSLTEGNA